MTIASILSDLWRGGGGLLKQAQELQKHPGGIGLIVLKLSLFPSCQLSMQILVHIRYKIILFIQHRFTIAVYTLRHCHETRAAQFGFYSLLTQGFCNGRKVCHETPLVMT